MTLPWFARAIPHTLNPAILPLARRLPPLAVIHHHGRHSGTSLPDTDHGYAPHGRLEHRPAVRQERRLGPQRAGRANRHPDVQLVPPATGASLLPRWARPVMRLLGVHHFITMRSPLGNATVA